MSEYILQLDSADATLARVGGKGANLAELARAGFAVPPGFLVTTEAYHAFVAANGLAEQIVALARKVAGDNPVALDHASEQIRALFAQGDMPAALAEPIVAAYRQLSSNAPNLPVAVRSSATAEDLPGLSFAGQQDTYLNIVGDDALLDAVRRCWGSLWTARALGYRARNGIAPDDVALAVVVQELISSEVSGVLFTANPLSGRRNEIVIDASYGLGEAIVSGQVEPDHYVVDPASWQITGRKLGAKALAIVPRAGGGTDQVARAAGEQALPDAQIRDLARTAARVAAHFGSPQDIEWAWANGRMLLLQSRPITSLYPLPEAALAAKSPRVYFSFNSVQGVVDPFTPLGLDLLQLLAGGFPQFLRADMPLRQAITTAGGRIFIDVTAITGPWMAALQRLDPGARIEPKYTITLTVPADRTEYISAIRLGRARYTALADRTLRFYREYFQPDHVIEIEKQRQRWRIMFRGEDFAINIDTLVGHQQPGPFLEIKSRTWSRRDADAKAALIGELLRLFGVDEGALVKQEYVEL